MPNRAADFINAVAESLGVSTRRIQQLVIDADVRNGVVRVYVKTVGEKAPGELCASEFESLEGVEVVVSPDVIVTPTAVTAGEPEPIGPR